MKRAFLLLSLIGLWAALSCTKPTDAVLDMPIAASLPNIIFIMADDMGWDAFGRYPGTTSTKANGVSHYFAGFLAGAIPDCYNWTKS